MEQCTLFVGCTSKFIAADKDDNHIDTTDGDVTDDSNTSDWTTGDITVTNACVMPVGFGVGDHRLLVIDFATTTLVG